MDKFAGYPRAKDVVDFNELECNLVMEAINNSKDLIDAGMLSFIAPERAYHLFSMFERTVHLALIPTPEMKRLFGVVVSHELSKTCVGETKKAESLKNILKKLKYEYRAN
jgi:hypothetical protein